MKQELFIDNSKLSDGFTKAINSEVHDDGKGFQSFSASMTVEHTPELEAFLESTKKEQQARKKEVSEHLHKIMTGYLQDNKPAFDQMEDAAGKEYAEMMIREFGRCFLVGLHLGWNECYEYHKNVFEKK